MTAPFPVSPARSRRNHTLSPSALSQLNASFGQDNSRRTHAMNRTSKTTTGEYTSTRDDTEVEDIRRGKRPSEKARSQEMTRTKHPLLGEIARLTASCEAHEREIRVSTTTIKRQLQDWSQNFDTLNELDNQAETMTAHIHHLSTTTQAEHSEHISTLIEAPEKNIDELQSKLEPWNSDYFEDDKDIIELDVGSTQKGIPRIQREKAQMGGLGILEHKARIVEKYYTDEEKRLNELVQAKWTKRRLFGRILSFTSTAVVLASIVIWLLLWTFEWR